MVRTPVSLEIITGDFASGVSPTVVPSRKLCASPGTLRRKNVTVPALAVASSGTNVSSPILVIVISIDPAGGSANGPVSSKVAARVGAAPSV